MMERLNISLSLCSFSQTFHSSMTLCQTLSNSQVMSCIDSRWHREAYQTNFCQPCNHPVSFFPLKKKKKKGGVLPVCRLKYCHNTCTCWCCITIQEHGISDSSYIKFEVALDLMLTHLLKHLTVWQNYHARCLECVLFWERKGFTIKNQNLIILLHLNHPYARAPLRSFTRPIENGHRALWGSE